MNADLQFAAQRLLAGQDRAVVLPPGAEVVCIRGRLGLSHPASQQRRVLPAGQGWHCTLGGTVLLQAMDAAAYRVVPGPAAISAPQNADGPRAWARGPWQRWFVQVFRRARRAA